MFIDRNGYIRSIDSVEDLYLIEKCGGEYYLKADIEIGGDNEAERVEVFKDFLLSRNMLLRDAVISCRDENRGGISFIEYDENHFQNALNDFLNYSYDEPLYCVLNKRTAALDDLAETDDGMFYINIR